MSTMSISAVVQDRTEVQARLGSLIRSLLHYGYAAANSQPPATTVCTERGSARHIL